MRRLIVAWGTFALALLLATIAAAQGTAIVNGQIFDAQGKPYADVAVVLKNSDTGQTFTLKTDKDGKFRQIGLRNGLYTVAVAILSYTRQFSVTNAQENNLTINLKDILAQEAASHPEEQKKREEEVNQFKSMKAHVDAGIAALNDSAQLRKQVGAAPADQKGAIQNKLTADYQTAVTEFEQAEKGVTAKDTKNHAVIWADLAESYAYAGRNDESASAYQKAIDLNPQAGYYVSMSTSLAGVAAAQTDLAATQAKLADASAACDKALTLDPTIAARCWKNIGILLNNKGRMKEAIEPLQKAAQANPKDAQTWFLLGGSLTGTIDTKQEGTKLIYIIPPGTADAYQKCIDADPNGPYAAEAKAAIENLNQFSAGEQTTVVGKKKKK